MSFKVLHVDGAPGIDLSIEAGVLAGVGGQLAAAGCRNEAEVLARCTDADALMVVFAPITRQVIESLTRCRVIVRYGVGVDNVDVAAATGRGIPVAYVPDYCIEEVSNHVLMFILASARKLRPLLRAVEENRTDYAALKAHLHQIGAIDGEVLGLLGFGKIAQTVARKAQAFGMQVLTYDPYVPDDVVRRHGVTQAGLDVVLAGSDYLSCHLPLSPETRDLLSVEHFRRMKPTAYFINTSRGGVVQEPALVQAVQSGWIAGAALDVVAAEPVRSDHPLAGLPNVLITPHTAFYSDRASRNLRRMAAEEAARVLAGGWPSPGRFLNTQVAAGG